LSFAVPWRQRQRLPYRQLSGASHSSAV
jgi:hypothetical protein